LETNCDTLVVKGFEEPVDTVGASVGRVGV
jgi:hypothetical protein